MKNLDKERIEQIIQTRKKAHSYYSKKSRVYRSFLDMERNTYMDGKLSKLEKEMIAIGISVAQNCESCMEWHIKQAYRKPGPKTDLRTWNKPKEQIDCYI